MRLESTGSLKIECSKSASSTKMRGESAYPCLNPLLQWNCFLGILFNRTIEVLEKNHIWASAWRWTPWGYVQALITRSCHVACISLRDDKIYIIWRGISVLFLKINDRSKGGFAPFQIQCIPHCTQLQLTSTMGHQRIRTSMSRQPARFFILKIPITMHKAILWNH